MDNRNFFGKKEGQCLSDIQEKRNGQFDDDQAEPEQARRLRAEREEQQGGGNDHDGARKVEFAQLAQLGDERLGEGALRPGAAGSIDSR